MMRHDESLMWQYAARELDSEDARVVQHHLTECPECQEHLSDVREAQGAIKAARGVLLQLDFQPVDVAIAAVVSKKLARGGGSSSAGSRGWLYGVGGALVTAGIALVAFGLWQRSAVAPVREELPALPAAQIAVKSTVERASGLTRVGTGQESIAAGVELESGDVLKTAAKGEALLHLPDGSRLKLSADSQLSLTRVEPEEVALTLERGRVFVAASHFERKGFVVHSGGLVVRVVGTTFSVASTSQGIEVSVAEGRVSVEPPDSLPLYVNAGQRTRFDTQRWRMKRDALNAAAKGEMMLVKADPPPPVPMPEPVAAVGGTMPPEAIASAVEPTPAPASAPVSPNAQRPGLLPRLSAAESRARGGGAARAANDGTPEIPPGSVALTEMASDMAADLKRPADVEAAPHPEMMQVPMLSSPIDSVGHAPLPAQNDGEWSAMPAKQAATKLNDEAIPEDAESIFLQRAERSVTRGTCERYLMGLDELASDAKHGERAERARVARAHCFDATMKPKQASEEYRRYLQEYPNGKYVDEAKQTLNDE